MRSSRKRTEMDWSMLRRGNTLTSVVMSDGGDVASVWTSPGTPRSGTLQSRQVIWQSDTTRKSHDEGYGSSGWKPLSGERALLSIRQLCRCGRRAECRLSGETSGLPLPARKRQSIAVSGMISSTLSPLHLATTQRSVDTSRRTLSSSAASRQCPSEPVSVQQIRTHRSNKDVCNYYLGS